MKTVFLGNQRILPLYLKMRFASLMSKHFMVVRIPCSKEEQNAKSISPELFALAEKSCQTQIAKYSLDHAKARLRVRQDTPKLTQYSQKHRLTGQ